MPDTSAHWRDSARRAKFFIVDANIIWPLLIFLISMGVRTGILLGSSLVFFLLMEKFNFTLKKVYRYCFVIIVGHIRYRKGWWE
jgi:intracellular multiplication protein IcmT